MESNTCIIQDDMGLTGKQHITNKQLDDFLMNTEPSIMKNLWKNVKHYTDTFVDSFSGYFGKSFAIAVAGIILYGGMKKIAKTYEDDDN